MSMKRKRSSVTLCASTTNTTLSLPQWQDKSRLPEYFSQSKPLDNLPFQNTCLPNPESPLDKHSLEPSYLNSRTRKRYRDGRPEESQIHATTVTRLFEAQKLLNNSSLLSQLTVQPTLQHTVQPQPSQTQHQHQFFPPQPQHPPQKSTLHSFWALPTTSAQHGSPTEVYTECMNCEDCDRPLVQQHVMDIHQDTACMACGRYVCDTCSIATDTRLCLSCAMQH